MIKKIIKH